MDKIRLLVRGIFLLPVFLCVCAAFAEPQKDTLDRTPLGIRVWWTKTSTALSDLRRAGEFSINKLIVENDVVVGWDVVIDGLCNYDFSDRYRRAGEVRQRVEDLRARFRAITAETRKQGIQCYIMCPEVQPPPGLKRLSYDDPELWTIIRQRLVEVFQALPELDGYMLYLCEGPQEIFELPGSEPSKANRAGKLIETVWEACRAERRKLLVTTFIHRLDKLEAIAEALKKFPPHEDLAVVQYCCPNDWGLYELLNPAIGRVGPHPEILAFDYAAENWGQGISPFVQVDFIARRLREARQRSTHIVGLAGYVAWYGRSVLGTFNEANVYAGLALAREPGREGNDILREWCGKRFGPAARVFAAACLARTHKAIFKAQHVLGYWLDTSNKSGLPSLKELDEYFIGDYWGEALGKWDPEYLPVWKKIQAPDELFLQKILREKEEAVDLCLLSLKELRQGRASFRPADFQALERAFSFQELWARLWREQVHAFFLRQISRQQGWTAERRDRLQKVLLTMLKEADELEVGFGRDVFPKGPARAREFVRQMRREIPPDGMTESVPAE